MCDHLSRVSLFNDEQIVDDDIRTRIPLLLEEENTDSFCHKCAVSDGLNIQNIYSEPVSESWHIRKSNELKICDSVPKSNHSDESFSHCLENESFQCPISKDQLAHCTPNGSSLCYSSSWKRLLLASMMCLIFMVAEIVGGYFAGSLAVMTDAAHLLSDIAGFLVSLFAIWIAQKSPNRRFSFGYYRAEILCALMSIVIVWMMTGIFVYLAISRILQGDYVIDADLMMIIAAVGVVINIVMGFTLHNDGHIHSRSHSHAHSSHGDINVRAALIHVLGDLLQSVGVFLAAVVIKIFPQAKLADPICTFLFSILVMATTVSIFKETVHVLMEGFPEWLDYSALVDKLSSIEGVENVHDLHVWSLTTNKLALAVHLAVAASTNSEVVLKKASTILRNDFDIHISTLQVERFHHVNDAGSCQSGSIDSFL